MTPLFDSALFATEKVETESGGGSSEDETKRTELYVDTSGAFSGVVIALGMRL